MLYATFQNLMLGGKYRQTSNIDRTKSPNLNACSLVLHLFLENEYEVGAATTKVRLILEIWR